jgi:hypothetical protein
LAEIESPVFLLAIAAPRRLLTAAHRNQVGDCTEHIKILPLPVSMSIYALGVVSKPLSG